MDDTIIQARAFIVHKESNKIVRVAKNSIVVTLDPAFVRAMPRHDGTPLFPIRKDLAGRARRYRRKGKRANSALRRAARSGAVMPAHIADDFRRWIDRAVQTRAFYCDFRRSQVRLEEMLLRANGLGEGGMIAGVRSGEEWDVYLEFRGYELLLDADAA